MISKKLEFYKEEFMTGLSDMEELISTVPEKEIADYLREAFVCYGSGAYRGCIVLTHIALFEGLRTKLQAVSAVNKAARQVLSIIEPDAISQKVFESKLVDQMKKEQIITQLDADILHDLNRHRNKAAHPSGHNVRAEEARFVFAESINKFLSKPIRQTSVLVESIVSRLPDPNFFPVLKMREILLVVEQEIENLDELGLPQLVANLSEAIVGQNVKSASNSRHFMCALASGRGPLVRQSILKQFIAPKSSDEVYASFICSLIGQDPEIVRNISDGLRIRILFLLSQNFESGKLTRDIRITNPFFIFEQMCKTLGEEFLIKNYKEYVDKVMEQGITSSPFINSLKNCPNLLVTLNEKYKLDASNKNFSIANQFASVLPDIDKSLASVITDEDATQLLVAVVKASHIGAFESIALEHTHFKSTPYLRDKVLNFIKASPNKVLEAISSVGLDYTDISDIENRFFSVIPSDTAEEE